MFTENNEDEMEIKSLISCWQTLLFNEGSVMCVVFEQNLQDVFDFWQPLVDLLEKLQKRRRKKNPHRTHGDLTQ